MKKVIVLFMLSFTLSAHDYSTFIQKNINDFKINYQNKGGLTSQIAWGTAAYQYSIYEEGFEWFCWSDSLGVYHIIADLEISLISQEIIKFIFPWFVRNYEGYLTIDFRDKLTLATITDNWYAQNYQFFPLEKYCRKMSTDYKIKSLEIMPVVKNIKVREYF